MLAFAPHKHYELVFGLLFLLWVCMVQVKHRSDPLLTYVDYLAVRVSQMFILCYLGITTQTPVR